MQLPPELDFLSRFFIDPKKAYRTASWLLSDFDASVWEYSFNYKKPKQLDWDITLDDGSRLIDQKNKDLLYGLKYYLTSYAGEYNSHSGATNESQAQQLQRFHSACHIIDFLLINGSRYQIAKYGLPGLTNGNLIEILETISSDTAIFESVYNWRNRLQQYCLNLLKTTDKNKILATLKNLPKISVITSEQQDDDTLGIHHSLIPQVRAALYLKGLYHKQVINGSQPNTTLLSKEIYPETLWGKNQAKSTHTILCFNDNTSTFDREYLGVPVASGSHEVMRESNFLPYRRALYGLGVLHEISLPAPSVVALMEAERFTPKYSAPGRFRTLPTVIVFNAIRQAIEFHLEHGESLTKAFCRIALECRKRKISPSSLTQNEVRLLVGKKLENLGINKISLASRFANFGQNDISIKGEKTEYFKSLRDNSGLLELMAIYIGGIQLTVGALMARRASELHELNAANCLDDSALWLIFRNAKSTRHLFGHRRREARPIEPIAADMIKTLIRMQMVLKRIGYIQNLQTLFSTPNLTGAASLTDCNPHMYNRNIDLFCDHFETPLNAAGERYYIRQHQLRRFFAMLFFYCGSFSKLDTLQWMVGHTDPKHIYHYITESTDGAVLAGAKAHYVAEQLHQGNVQNYQELSDLLMKIYGTDNFNLIDTNDLEDQIQDLMSEGWVEIEPEFFTDHQGHKFKVVARLIREVAA
jgi:hypothetical protein